MPQSSTQTFNTTTDNGCDIKIETEHATYRVITTTDLVCWAAQVACGMEYLASREILHGDLAARNILLCDHNVVKICDFGLARSMNHLDIYKKKDKESQPFKWLALECIKDNMFSTRSDVWAYGIMLWEFFSLGKLPYQTFNVNHELYIKLKEGHRMKKPDYATDGIYDIMLRCWNETPRKRPSFQQLKREFYAMLPDVMRIHYVALNELYVASKTVQKEFEHLNDFLEEPPASPQNVCGVIPPLPPVSEHTIQKDIQEQPRHNSEIHNKNFNIPSINTGQISPTLRKNLNNNQPIKRYEKTDISTKILNTSISGPLQPPALTSWNMQKRTSISCPLQAPTLAS